MRPNTRCVAHNNGCKLIAVCVGVEYFIDAEPYFIANTEDLLAFDERSLLLLTTCCPLLTARFLSSIAHDTAAHYHTITTYNIVLYRYIIANVICHGCSYVGYGADKAEHFYRTLQRGTQLVMSHEFFVVHVDIPTVTQWLDTADSEAAQHDHDR